MPQTLQQLAERVGGEVVGDPDLEIRGCATLEEAQAGDLSFLANPKYADRLGKTQASAVVVAPKVRSAGVSLIRTDDPYYAFTQILVELYGYRRHEPVGVHPMSCVAESARLGQNVSVYQFTTVSADAVVGDNTVIYPNCYVGPGARIGSDCIIYPNVTIYDRCVIGCRVTIHSGTVIGNDGFGYATHGGRHHKIPHVGIAVIEDDCEIGANCAIDRGTLGRTRIGEGTKFSNLIAIGHNAELGRHGLLVAQSGIAGSTKVGDYLKMGGQAGVANHLKIGDHVELAAQAGVMDDIPDHTAVMGAPARPIEEMRKNYASFLQLHKMRATLRALEREVRHFIKGTKGHDKGG